MAAGGGLVSKQFRIIEKLTGTSKGMYELQKRWVFGWKTIASDIHYDTLRKIAKQHGENRMKFRVIEEFDVR